MKFSKKQLDKMARDYSNYLEEKINDELIELIRCDSNIPNTIDYNDLINLSDELIALARKELIKKLSK